MTDTVEVLRAPAPVAGDAVDATPASRARRVRTRLLPRGVDLPAQAFDGRHRSVLTFLVALSVAAVVLALADTRSAPRLVEAAGVAVVASAGLAVPFRHRRLAASVASFGMLLATAVLVHVSGGLIEMHFLFFVIVAAVTLYQQWAPFLTAVGFVALHHGVVGTAAPASTYNHPDAVADPWLWAGIHAGFVALASVVGLAAWRFDELVREELRRSGEDTRVALDAVGDAVLGLDDAGRVRAANARATALLAADGIPLAGRHVHGLVHPTADHPAERCPLTRRGRGTDVVGRPGHDAVPVAYRSAAVQGGGPSRAVLTLRDLSDEQRADRAERQLRHVSAERRAERAETEQLTASVRPAALTVPGCEVAATYLPASGALIGGDLYDWFRTPDGTVHLSVIDAMGKGVSATKQAIAVLHAVRVLALDGIALEALVARADAVLGRHDPELAATVVAARYSPVTGVLRITSGGHPPPLLVRPDGSTSYLDCTGLGIGVPGAGSLRLAEVVLQPGDAVVLYSDGLVEGTRDLGRGLHDLAVTAGLLAHAPATELAERLATEPGSVSADDDRVALVLRRL